MYVTTHLMAGATAGSVIKNPLVSFLVGVGTHAILDMLPHEDYDHISKGIVDLIFGLALLTYLYSIRGSLALLTGALGGALPDIEVAIRDFKKDSVKIFPTHTGLLRHGRAKTRWGVYGQFLFIGAVAILLSF